jgi:hypothetical protein
MKIILDEEDLKELIKQKYSGISNVEFKAKKGNITAILESDKAVTVARPTPKPTGKQDISMTGEGRERKMMNLG